jgi:hypothetical protein
LLRVAFLPTKDNVTSREAREKGRGEERGGKQAVLTSQAQDMIAFLSPPCGWEVCYELVASGWAWRQ